MPNLAGTAKRLYRALTRFQDAFCAIGLFASTLLIFVQVVNRFALHVGLVWVLDLALYIYMMTVFVAAAVATRERGHVAVEYFSLRWFRRRPVGMARWLFALTLVSLAAALTFVQPAWQFMLKSIRFPQYSALLPGFDTNWIKIVFVCAFLVVVLHLAINLVQDFANARRARALPPSTEMPK